MRNASLYVAMGAGIVVLACGGGGDSAGNAVTRDSAGITIVENSGPAWTGTSGWRVVDSPMVDIGGRAGEAAYEFDQAAGPVRLSDGRLAVANGGSKEIRFYDPQGVHVRSSGREGSGPGEFQFMTGLWKGPGDSVLVFDVMVRRLSVLDREGAFTRSMSLGGASGAPMPTDGKLSIAIPVVWLADGTLLGQSMVFSIGEAREGFYRDSMDVLRYGPDGSVRDTVGRFPGPEMQQMTLTFAGQSMSTPDQVPLGRETVSAAHGDRYYLGLNNAWEIEVRGLDGTIKQVFRVAATPTPITPQDVEAHRKIRLELMEQLPQIRNLPDAIKKVVTDQMSAAKYPETFSFITRLLVDSEGNLWAHEVRPPAEKTARFAVLDPTGRFLGRVTMPVDFTPSQITSDAVFGIWKDADDVEHVRAYPLRKG